MNQPLIINKLKDRSEKQNIFSKLLYLTTNNKFLLVIDKYCNNQ